MPVLTQTFSHTMESLTVTNAGVYNSVNSLDRQSFLYKEPSILFWQDLKSVLQEAAGLDITFSENDEFIDKEQAPYFSIWGLNFSPFVFAALTHVNSYSLVPCIARQYEYAPTTRSFRDVTTNNAENNNAMAVAARINKSNTEKLDLEYTIEVRYNEDFLLIEYRPYADKAKKFTLCCLMKGVDINDKVVVYLSGGCNTYSVYSSAGFINNAYVWASYHKLVWPESPAKVPYTGAAAYPTYDSQEPTSRSAICDTRIFIDLVNNMMTPHSSRISLYGTDDKNILFQKPICCWGRVNFGDNILTGPMTLTPDTEYEINGEIYYCPGDYTTTQAIAYGIRQDQYGMRFLLKL